jgi:aspartate kinase
MALHALGLPAIAYTGAQAGILTESMHTRARIVKIDPGNLETGLARGDIVIVAGFQGSDPFGQTTTLGRGASDLTAIALASAIKADLCQIFTDVEGVFSADPRIVPEARKISEISYDEMLELASLGSKVMQSRSVEFAKKFGVVFEVRSSFNDKPGTIVKEEVASMEDVVVRGVAVDKNQAKVIVSSIADRPGTAAQVFQTLAKAGVVVDMIVQNVGRSGVANLTFTVPRDDAHRAQKAVGDVLSELGGGDVQVFEGVAKLSVVGVGMRTHSGAAGTLFGALAEVSANIQIISTSEISISVLIDGDRADDAARAAHRAFKLGG